VTVDVAHDELKGRKEILKYRKKKRLCALERDGMTVLKLTGSMDEHKLYIGCLRMNV